MRAAAAGLLQRAGPQLQLLRLHRPVDLGLLLLTTLWGLWLGSNGTPAPLTVLLLLAAVLLARSAGWLLHDIGTVWLAHPTHTLRQVIGVLSPTLRLTLALTLLGAAGLLALLGRTTLLTVAVAALVALSCLPLRRRTFLGELVLSLALAAGTLAGFAAAGALFNKSAWLVYTAAVMWCGAYQTQYASLHLQQHARLGIKSISMLFGTADRWLIAALQLAALLALGLAGQQEKLGVFMHLALAVGAALATYQQWLMASGVEHDYRRAYNNNLWFGLALFCGIWFHYLCVGQGNC